jgi:hypothetical protein
VRCWGEGTNGLLGSCSSANVGDDETPGSAGPVDLGDPGRPGAGCAPPPVPSAPVPAAPRVPATPAKADDGLAAQARRAAALRRCRSTVAGRARAQRRLVRARPARARAKILRAIAGRARQADRACAKRNARTPGRVTSFTARAKGARAIALVFRATGSDGAKPPAAQRYLIKQSLRPIRTSRDFSRAHALCKGACTFAGAGLGSTITLSVTDLLPRRTYYYAVAARDNVTAFAGPRSRTVKARTR